jgi:hypothetical protein
MRRRGDIHSRLDIAKWLGKKVLEWGLAGFILRVIIFAAAYPTYVSTGEWPQWYNVWHELFRQLVQ